jgi:hypothetical protein
MDGGGMLLGDQRIKKKLKSFDEGLKFVRKRFEFQRVSFFREC